MAAEALGQFFPEEIRYFKSRVSWSVDAGVDLDQIASDKDLKELERLTGCQFVKVLNERTIYIGGHLEESCKVAIDKLKILRNYPVSEAMVGEPTEANSCLVAQRTVD
jgi:hypothetical protein